MSKQIKSMQMAVLDKELGEAKNLVFLNMTGTPVVAETAMRLALRKKNVRLHHVKTSLARLVLAKKGLTGADEYLTGPTVIALGTDSVAALCKELEPHLEKNSKTIKPKGAVAEGSVLSFDDAKKLPTREEAIGKLLGALLGPASSLLGALQGPGSTLAGQLKSLSEKKDEPAAAPPAA